MNEAPRRRWYVEDRVAEQALATLLDTAHDVEPVRLDRPGWRDLQRARGAVTGLVVGAGERPLDLAVAVADLAARRDELTLVLPADGVDEPDWLTACAGWHVVDVDRRPEGAVVVRATADGDGPPLGSLTALHHRRRPRPRTRVVAPWRVDLRDATARAWFGDLVTTTRRASLAVASASMVDAVPARSDAPDDPNTRRLVVASGAAPAPADDDAVAVTDDPTLAGEHVRLVARPVDLRRYSPVGCDPRGADGPPVLPISSNGQPDQVVDARQAAAPAMSTLGMTGEPDELALPADGLPSGADVLRLRRTAAVLDHPGLHADDAAHARWLLAVVASGVPVLPLAALPGPVAQLVGDRVADELAATTAADVAEPDLRERTSVRQRRAVLARHTATARLHDLADDLGLLAARPRPVTIVLATNRADFIEFACRQIARQDWPNLEVVVLTHGARSPASADRAVAEHLGHLPTVRRHVDQRWTLGDALNIGIELAAGEVITKFDDDDWYSPSHVTEMLQAMAYSGADVVGRAAEFVHLASGPTTLRRWGHGGEAYSPTLAGGTLTFPKDVWRDIGGFPRVGLGEDRGIVEDTREAGGTTYRCSPFGYLLHRHGRHAWSVDDQAFLDAAVATRPGLDNDWTLT